MAHIPTPTRLALAAACLLALGAVPAAAQGILGSSSPVTTAPDDGSRWRQQPKPAALPGARTAQPAPAAAAERPAAEMRPTEALFDAVNRGDIAAARDALGRGADIDGRNILGLTSLELAVDLGRNDITFLLLSMRGAAGSSSMAPPPPQPAARATAAPAPARVAAAPAQPAPQRTRAANADPGTPVPQAGFLGFGAPSR